MTAIDVLFRVKLQIYEAWLCAPSGLMHGGSDIVLHFGFKVCVLALSGLMNTRYSQIYHAYRCDVSVAVALTVNWWEISILWVSEYCMIDQLHL